jgi:adenosylcobinamide-phosphate synthase
MIGYNNGLYRDLGRFAAKSDDAAGFIPDRLAALLLILSARLWGLNWQRDGHLHASPNAGQAEAAMAGEPCPTCGAPIENSHELCIRGYYITPCMLEFSVWMRMCQ